MSISLICFLESIGYGSRLTNTPGDLVSLRVTDCYSGLRGSEQTEIVDSVEGNETSVRGLVDGSSHSGSRGVGCSLKVDKT
jgi:hypothetical protein